MRILMLGWEFPPYIAGGLGVACYGLTKALDAKGHTVLFVLPKPVDRSKSSHVRMLSPSAGLTAAVAGLPSLASVGGVPVQAGQSGATVYGFEHATFYGVPATFHHSYPGSKLVGGDSRVISVQHAGLREDEDEADVLALREAEAGAGGNGGLGAGSAPGAKGAPQATRGFLGTTGGGAGVGYGNDLVGDAERYARMCVAMTRREEYDVIHAHDWLTFPAGVALARVTGKPLVVQVHSTEFDRSGANVHQRVYDIERMGMHAADRVVCVSELTKNICVRRYGVPADKVDVVYNGLARDAHQPAHGPHIESDDKVVLFLGRITMQKGPEYFISAAKRVLEQVPNAKFVLAGSGDMALRMVELAAKLGIGHRVMFTGFLRGGEIERIFRMADCYVMPSVSEPFGLAALEAMSHDVPVILSKTSGASEVLHHVLKVDFWDIDDIANKIVAVLRHPPLGSTLREHGHHELQRLTWEHAADQCVRTYGAAQASRAQQASA